MAVYKQNKEKMMSQPFQIVVLFSGNGSNLQALINEQMNFGYCIAGVISNRADAYGLTRASEANINNYVVPHQKYANRDMFDDALIKTIDHLQADLVVMAGFMRILTAKFTCHYEGKLINIHPSLLPAWKGLDTYRRVLASGEKRHGTTVHFVTEELDSGGIIAQASTQITDSDDEFSLKKRVQQMEHRLFPMTVKWFAEKRLKQENGVIWLDGKKLPLSGCHYTYHSLVT